MGFYVRLRCLVFTFGWLLYAQSLVAYQHDDFSAEELQQIKATERFYEVLQKAPKRGTAFDRVYSHHLEFGTLDSLMESLQDKVKKSPEDGNGWMLLGLLESQRGDDVSAAKSFEQATLLLTKNALPAFYLGQSLVRNGNGNEAIAAFEQSLARNPSRTDRLEIYGQMGKVYQRAQRSNDALEVWKRLEREFPDDLRVLEQIAVTMSEEGDFASAIPRLERLAELVKDDYRRTVFRVQSAKLKIKTNQRESGLKELESVLQSLNPTSWLYRDVRNKIEETFLSANDPSGLVTYYLQWLTTSPEDIEGMARLAKFLTVTGRVDEADTWMTKAIALAPSRSDLRKAYINQLLDQKRISNAIEQYRSLASFEPSNPDYLRDWGKLVLRDGSLSVEVRNQEAKRIWKQLQELRPDDASHVARVADLLRNAGFHPEAKTLLEQAVELAPNDAQYREYLGEFLHVQERSPEATRVWKSMAEDARRNVPNLTRLADVFKRFGFHDRAVETIEDACRLDPSNFPLQLDAAQYCARVERTDAALQHVAAAESLASTDEERETSMQQRIGILQSSGQLDKAIVQLATEIRKEKAASPDRWHTLAKYCLTESQLPLAQEAIDNAIQGDEKSIPYLSTASKIAEASGDLNRAIQLCRKLASVDRRFLSEYLMTIAKHELQLNRPEAAFKAAQELVTSAPGNTGHYEFLAQISFKAGKIEEGLSALRRAARINPNEPNLHFVLASALAERGKPDEAIEIYWRSFDRAEKLDDQTLLIEKLVPLYNDKNQLSTLIDRLSLLRRDEEKRRAMTICIAQAYTTAKDLVAARRELESLLTDDTRDTTLLQQLAKLCQDSKDLENAVKYQKQLVGIAPGAETEMPLISMLRELGNDDEANSLTLSLAEREDNPTQRLRTLDSLFTQSNYAAVTQVTQPLLLKESDNWELLYREGVALALQDSSEQSVRRFRQLLGLKTPHETLGVIARENRMKSNSRKKNESQLKESTISNESQSPLETLKIVSRIQAAVQLDDSQMQTLPIALRQQMWWMPESYGHARMAAFAWLLKFDTEDVLVRETYDTGIRASKEGHSITKESMYDFLYVATLRGKAPELFEVSRIMAMQGGLLEKELFLSMVQKQRSIIQGTNLSALDDTDLQLLVKCFESLPRSKQLEGGLLNGLQIKNLNSPFFFSGSSGASLSSQLLQQRMMQQRIIQQQMMAVSTTGQISGTSVVYSNLGVPGTVTTPNTSSGSMVRPMLRVVLDELNLAGKSADASALLDRLVASITDLREFNNLLAVCSSIQDFKKISELYPKWMEIAKQDIKKNGVQVAAGNTANSFGIPTGPFEDSATILSQWIGNLAPEQKHEEILRVLDPVLDLAILRSKELQLQRSILHRKRSVSPRPFQLQQTMHVIHYGSETTYASIDFPPPNDYVDNSASLLLRQVYEVFLRNNEIDLLDSHLRARLEKADEPSRVNEQFYLACALWWKNEQEEATELMLDASRALPSDTLLQLQTAALLQHRRDFGTAMKIVESTITSDPNLEQRKLWLIVSLAEQLGETSRAIDAVQRLSSMQLDPQSFLQLASYAQRLGLNELVAATIKKQTATRSSATIGQRSGVSVNAIQNAKATLARPHQFQRTQNIPFVDPSRKRALDTLQSTGELRKMIAALEGDFAKSPKTFSKHEQLAEFYGHINQQEKIDDLFSKGIELSTNSTNVRAKYARYLALNGKNAAAIGLYYPLMQDHPEILSDQLLLLINCFDREKKLQDATEFLRSFNLRSIVNINEQIQLLRCLFSARDLVPIAGHKFEQFYELQPRYRVLALENAMPNPSIPGLEFSKLILPAIRSSLIPGPKIKSLSPWHGLDDLYQSRNMGQQLQGLFNASVRLLETKELENLFEAVREASSKDPAWLGGMALSLLLDLRTNRESPDIVANKLRMLLSRETIDKLPLNVAWNLALALEQFENTSRIELDLLERAVELSPGIYTGTFKEHSPIANFIRRSDQLGNKEQARKWMRKQIATLQIPQWQLQNFDVIRFECAFSLAEKMIDLESPWDAIQVYQQLQASAVGIANIPVPNSVNSRDAQTPKSRCETGIKTAQMVLSKLPQEMVVAQLAQLLKQSAGTFPMSVSVSNNVLPNLTSNWLENVELLIQVATIKGPSQVAFVWSQLESELVKLEIATPEDRSIAIAIAWVRFKSGSEQTKDSLNKLQTLAARHSFDELTEAERPSSMQRKDAAPWIVFWLVARECFAQGEKVAGENLGKKALEGAMRQSNKQWQKAILREWAERTRALDDAPAAEEMLSKLLELVSTRPKRKADHDSSVVTLVIPMYRQQMIETIAIAKMASDLGMNELSRRAIRIACEGGMPPPEISSAFPVVNSLNASGIAGATSMNYVVGSNRGIPADLTLSRELVNTVSSWRAVDHPANEVFLLLRDIVFSKTPRKTVELHAVPSTKAGGKSEQASVAGELVYWANKASKLDELESYMDSWTTTMERSQFQTQVNIIRNLIQRTRSENSAMK